MRAYVSSLFGTVLVEASATAITAVRFVAEPGAEGPAEVGTRPAWFADALDRLRAYLSGDPVTFDDLPVDLTGQTSFRRKVLEACRRIPYGKSLTYSELAARVGRPAAVRAVGSAMSHNPVALIVPCHRVLRAGGGLGGFSAPGGVAVKRRLLELEGACELPLAGPGMVLDRPDHRDAANPAARDRSKHPCLAHGPR